MQVHKFQVDPVLVPYIDSIWTFTTETALSQKDIRTVPPTAKPKLLLSLRGSMSCHINHRSFEHLESRIMVCGAMDEPAIIDSGPLTSLGVDFRPGMAYRFLGVPMKDLLNAVYPLNSVLGQIAEELQWQMEDKSVIEDKVRLIQEFLIHRLYALSNEDRLIDAAVSIIESTSGRMSIKVLCQELGYSKQYLDRKFKDRLGLSPKGLSRILRFQSIYEHWMVQPVGTVSWQEHLELYYDQAHFIKEFKHFTGFSPNDYTQQVNTFMRTFYQS